jgi:hypothetical protein
MRSAMLGKADTIDAIRRRDRRWRARQEKWRSPGMYSNTNAARGARDRMLLLLFIEKQNHVIAQFLKRGRKTR